MKLHKSLKELIKFGIVGVVNTLLDMVIYLILTVYFGIFKYLAQTISYSISMIHSYLVNRFWTFGRRGKVESAAEPVKFVAVNLISLGISFLCFYLIGFWTQNLVVADNMRLFIEKLIVTPTVMAVNFLLNKIWVFQEEKHEGN